jgi:hypothetical protein
MFRDTACDCICWSHIFDPQDIGDMFLRNVALYPNCTALFKRKCLFLAFSPVLYQLFMLRTIEWEMTRMLSCTGGGGIGRGLFLKLNEVKKTMAIHIRDVWCHNSDTNEEYPTFEVGIPSEEFCPLGGAVSWKSTDYRALYTGRWNSS